MSRLARVDPHRGRDPMSRRDPLSNREMRDPLSTHEGLLSQYQKLMRDNGNTSHHNAGENDNIGNNGNFDRSDFTHIFSGLNSYANSGRQGGVSEVSGSTTPASGAATSGAVASGAAKSGATVSGAATSGVATSGAATSAATRTSESSTFLNGFYQLIHILIPSFVFNVFHFMGKGVRILFLPFNLIFNLLAGLINMLSSVIGFFLSIFHMILSNILGTGKVLGGGLLTTGSALTTTTIGTTNSVLSLSLSLLNFAFSLLKLALFPLILLSSVAYTVIGSALSLLKSIFKLAGTAVLLTFPIIGDMGSVVGDLGRVVIHIGGWFTKLISMLFTDLIGVSSDLSWNVVKIGWSNIGRLLFMGTLLPTLLAMLYAFNVSVAGPSAEGKISRQGLEIASTHLQKLRVEKLLESQAKTREIEQTWKDFMGSPSSLNIYNKDASQYLLNFTPSKNSFFNHIVASSIPAKRIAVSNVNSRSMSTPFPGDFDSDSSNLATNTAGFDVNSSNSVTNSADFNSAKNVFRFLDPRTISDILRYAAQPETQKIFGRFNSLPYKEKKAYLSNDNSDVGDSILYTANSLPDPHQYLSNVGGNDSGRTLDKALLPFSVPHNVHFKVLPLFMVLSGLCFTGKPMHQIGVGHALLNKKLESVRSPTVNTVIAKTSELISTTSDLVCQAKSSSNLDPNTLLGKISESVHKFLSVLNRIAKNVGKDLDKASIGDRGRGLENNENSENRRSTTSAQESFQRGQSGTQDKSTRDESTQDAGDQSVPGDDSVSVTSEVASASQESGKMRVLFEYVMEQMLSAAPAFAGVIPARDAYGVPLVAKQPQPLVAQQRDDIIWRGGAVERDDIIRRNTVDRNNMFARDDTVDRDDRMWRRNPDADRDTIMNRENTIDGITQQRDGGWNGLRQQQGDELNGMTQQQRDSLRDGMTEQQQYNLRDGMIQLRKRQLGMIGEIAIRAGADREEIWRQTFPSFSKSNGGAMRKLLIVNSNHFASDRVYGLESVMRYDDDIRKNRSQNEQHSITMAMEPGDFQNDNADFNSRLERYGFANGGERSTVENLMDDFKIDIETATKHAQVMRIKQNLDEQRRKQDKFVPYYDYACLKHHPTTVSQHPTDALKTAGEAAKKLSTGSPDATGNAGVIEGGATPGGADGTGGGSAVPDATGKTSAVDVTSQGPQGCDAFAFSLHVIEYPQRITNRDMRDRLKEYFKTTRSRKMSTADAEQRKAELQSILGYLDELFTAPDTTTIRTDTTTLRPDTTSIRAHQQPEKEDQQRLIEEEIRAEDLLLVEQIRATLLNLPKDVKTFLAFRGTSSSSDFAIDFNAVFDSFYTSAEDILEVKKPGAVPSKTVASDWGGTGSVVSGTSPIRIPSGVSETVPGTVHEAIPRRVPEAVPKPVSGAPPNSGFRFDKELLDLRSQLESEIRSGDADLTGHLLPDGSSSSKGGYLRRCESITSFRSNEAIRSAVVWLAGISKRPELTDIPTLPKDPPCVYSGVLERMNEQVILEEFKPSFNRASKSTEEPTAEISLQPTSEPSQAVHEGTQPVRENALPVHGGGTQEVPQGGTHPADEGSQATTESSQKINEGPNLIDKTRKRLFAIRGIVARAQQQVVQQVIERFQGRMLSARRMAEKRRTVAERMDNVNNPTLYDNPSQPGLYNIHKLNLEDSRQNIQGVDDSKQNMRRDISGTKKPKTRPFKLELVIPDEIHLLDRVGVVGFYPERYGKEQASFFPSPSEEVAPDLLSLQPIFSSASPVGPRLDSLQFTTAICGFSLGGAIAESTALYLRVLEREGLYPKGKIISSSISGPPTYNLAASEYVYKEQLKPDASFHLYNLKDPFVSPYANPFLDAWGLNYAVFNDLQKRWRYELLSSEEDEKSETDNTQKDGRVSGSESGDQKSSVVSSSTESKPGVSSRTVSESGVSSGTEPDSETKSDSLIPASISEPLSSAASATADVASGVASATKAGVESVIAKVAAATAKVASAATAGAASVEASATESVAAGVAPPSTASLPSPLSSTAIVNSPSTVDSTPDVKVDVKDSMPSKLPLMPSTPTKSTSIWRARLDEQLKLIQKQSAKLDEFYKADTERQKQDEKHQVEIERKKQDEKHQAEIERKKQDEKHQAEIERKKQDEKHQVEIERKKQDEKHQAEIERKKQDEKHQAEIERKEQDEKHQAEIERKKQDEKYRKGKNGSHEGAETDRKVSNDIGKEEPSAVGKVGNLNAAVKSHPEKKRYMTLNEYAVNQRELKNLRLRLLASVFNDLILTDMFKVMLEPSAKGDPLVKSVGDPIVKGVLDICARRREKESQVKSGLEQHSTSSEILQFVEGQENGEQFWNLLEWLVLKPARGGTLVPTIVPSLGSIIAPTENPTTKEEGETVKNEGDASATGEARTMGENAGSSEEADSTAKATAKVSEDSPYGYLTLSMFQRLKTSTTPSTGKFLQAVVETVKTDMMPTVKTDMAKMSGNDVASEIIASSMPTQTAIEMMPGIDRMFPIRVSPMVVPPEVLWMWEVPDFPGDLDAQFSLRMSDDDDEGDYYSEYDEPIKKQANAEQSSPDLGRDESISNGSVSGYAVTEESVAGESTSHDSIGIASRIWNIMSGLEDDLETKAPDESNLTTASLDESQQSGHSGEAKALDDSQVSAQGVAPQGVTVDESRFSGGQTKERSNEITMDDSQLTLASNLLHQTHIDRIRPVWRALWGRGRTPPILIDGVDLNLPTNPYLRSSMNSDGNWNHDANRDMARDSIEDTSPWYGTVPWFSGNPSKKQSPSERRDRSGELEDRLQQSEERQLRQQHPTSAQSEVGQDKQTQSTSSAFPKTRNRELNQREQQQISVKRFFSKVQRAPSRVWKVLELLKEEAYKLGKKGMEWIYDLAMKEIQWTTNLANQIAIVYGDYNKLPREWRNALDNFDRQISGALTMERHKVMNMSLGSVADKSYLLGNHFLIAGPIHYITSLQIKEDVVKFGALIRASNNDDDLRSLYGKTLKAMTDREAIREGQNFEEGFEGEGSVGNDMLPPGILSKSSTPLSDTLSSLSSSGNLGRRELPAGASADTDFDPLERWLAETRQKGRDMEGSEGQFATAALGGTDIALFPDEVLAKDLGPRDVSAREGDNGSMTDNVSPAGVQEGRDDYGNMTGTGSPLGKPLGLFYFMSLFRKHFLDFPIWGLKSIYSFLKASYRSLKKLGWRRTLISIYQVSLQASTDMLKRGWKWTSADLPRTLIFAWKVFIGVCQEFASSVSRDLATSSPNSVERMFKVFFKFLSDGVITISTFVYHQILYVKHVVEIGEISNFFWAGWKTVEKLLRSFPKDALQPFTVTPEAEDNSWSASVRNGASDAWKSIQSEVSDAWEELKGGWETGKQEILNLSASSSETTGPLGKLLLSFENAMAAVEHKIFGPHFVGLTSVDQLKRVMKEEVGLAESEDKGGSDETTETDEIKNAKEAENKEENKEQTKVVTKDQKDQPLEDQHEKPIRKPQSGTLPSADRSAPISNEASTKGTTSPFDDQDSLSFSVTEEENEHEGLDQSKHARKAVEDDFHNSHSARRFLRNIKPVRNNGNEDRDEVLERELGEDSSLDFLKSTPVGDSLVGGNALVGTTGTEEVTADREDSIMVDPLIVRENDSFIMRMLKVSFRMIRVPYYIVKDILREYYPYIAEALVLKLLFAHQIAFVGDQVSNLCKHYLHRPYMKHLYDPYLKQPLKRGQQSIQYPFKMAYRWFSHYFGWLERYTVRLVYWVERTLYYRGKKTELGIWIMYENAKMAVENLFGIVRPTVVDEGAVGDQRRVEQKDLTTPTGFYYVIHVIGQLIYIGLGVVSLPFAGVVKLWQLLSSILGIESVQKPIPREETAVATTAGVPSTSEDTSTKNKTRELTNRNPVLPLASGKSGNLRPPQRKPQARMPAKGSPTSNTTVTQKEGGCCEDAAVSQEVGCCAGCGCDSSKAPLGIPADEDGTPTNNGGTQGEGTQPNDGQLNQGGVEGLLGTQEAIRQRLAQADGVKGFLLGATVGGQSLVANLAGTLAGNTVAAGTAMVASEGAVAGSGGLAVTAATGSGAAATGAGAEGAGAAGAGVAATGAAATGAVVDGTAVVGEGDAAVEGSTAGAAETLTPRSGIIVGTSVGRATLAGTTTTTQALTNAGEANVRMGQASGVQSSTGAAAAGATGGLSSVGGTTGATTAAGQTAGASAGQTAVASAGTAAGATTSTADGAGAEAAAGGTAGTVSGTEPVKGTTEAARRSRTMKTQAKPTTTSLPATIPSTTKMDEDAESTTDGTGDTEGSDPA